MTGFRANSGIKRKKITVSHTTRTYYNAKYYNACTNVFFPRVFELFIEDLSNTRCSTQVLYLFLATALYYTALKIYT